MKRNYGIDLLRMILMFMVVILHILGHGGVLDSAGTMTVKYGVLWLIEGFAYCAVDCYALISGYVNFGRKFRLSSFAQLYLQVFLYSMGLTVFVWFLNPASFSFGTLVDVLFPVSSSAYWYLTAYFGLFILIPFLNAAVNATSKEQAGPYMLLAFFVFTVLPTLARHDTFRVYSGYSTFWLAFLYVIGACIRKFGWFDSLSAHKAFGVYLLSVLFSWGTKLCAEGITMKLLDEPSAVFYFIAYTSPTIVIAAVALFLTFKNTALSPKVSKAVSMLSPMSFGVYLIHDHSGIREAFFAGRFAFLAEWPIPLMASGIIFFALAIFAGCLLIDWVRCQFFRRMRVNERLEKLEEKYIHPGFLN